MCMRVCAYVCVYACICVCVCMFIGLPSTEIVQPGDVIDALDHYPIHVCMCVFYVCMRGCVCVQICKYMNTKVLLSLQLAATRCSTLQHDTTYSKLEHSATHSNALYTQIRGHTNVAPTHIYIFFARSHVHTHTHWHIHAHFLFPFFLSHHTHLTHMCCSHARTRARLCAHVRSLSFALSAR